MNKNPLQTLLNNTFTTFEQVLNNYQPQIQTREIGIIKSLTQGIANISGLPNVKADELLRFSGDILGIAKKYNAPGEF
jgi:F-type H+/Na+-transporting ATPase subunit alpha